MAADPGKITYALIVEDDQNLGNVFTEALRRAGYETTTVMDGQSALAHMADNTPNMVVLDLHLPDVPGERVLRWMREQGRFDPTWVIVASADARLADELRDRADLVLVKPVGFNQLRELAQRLRPNITRTMAGDDTLPGGDPTQIG